MLESQRIDLVRPRDGRMASVLAVWIAAAFIVVRSPGSAPALEVRNDLTANPITIDGEFSGGIRFPVGAPRGVIQGEWSDVDFLGFVTARPNANGLEQAPVNNRLVDSLFGVVARIGNRPVTHLHAIFVFRPRSESFVRGVVVGEIRTPFIIDGTSNPDFRLVILSAGQDTFAFGFDRDGNGQNDGLAADIGIEAAASFGPSPLARQAHLIVEVRWPFAAPNRNRLQAAGGEDLGEGGGAGAANGLDPDAEVEVDAEFVPDELDVPRGGAEVVVELNKDGGVVAGSDVPCVECALDMLFRRGDGNSDAVVDVSDPVFVLGCLFQGSKCAACQDAADSNDDGEVDISDPIGVLQWLFQGADAPLPPGPFACGMDVAVDDLEDCPQDPEAGCV